MTTTAIASPADEPERRPRRSRKRVNGEGTIYQRKDGRWEGAAYVLTTAGTFKRVRAYGRTHEEARKKLTKLVEQNDQGIPVASVNWTVAEYLTYWLEHIVKDERRPKTYQGYEGVVRLHLIPGLGKKRLSKLTAQDVRAYITRIRNECLCCKAWLGCSARQAAMLRAQATSVLPFQAVGADDPVHTRGAAERP